MSDWAIQSKPAPTTFVQWKGTDICADFYCLCGEQFHFDGMFCYAIECPHCHRRYELSQRIELREMPADEVWNGCSIVVGEKDHE